MIPGGVATNITTNSGVAMPIDMSSPEMAEMAKRKVATPEEAATAILDGMEKDAYRVLIGRDSKTHGPVLPDQPQGRDEPHREADEGPAEGVAKAPGVLV